MSWSFLLEWGSPSISLRDNSWSGTLNLPSIKDKRHIFHSLLSNVLSNKYYHHENLTFLASCIIHFRNCAIMSHNSLILRVLYRDEDDNYRRSFSSDKSITMIYIIAFVMTLINFIYYLNEKELDGEKSFNYRTRARTHTQSICIHTYIDAVW